MTAKGAAPKRRQARTERGPEDPSALAAVVLSEEARRQEQQQQRTKGERVLPDELLPGVGDRGMPLRDVIRTGGLSTVAILTLLNLVDEFDRAALQVLAPDIQSTLGVSDTVIALLGALTGVTFILGAVPLGYLADRMRRTWLVAGASMVFAAFMLLSGLVRNAWQLAVARIMTGAGKANTLPVHNSMLADAYPIAGRARIYGLHNLSMPVGLLIGPLLAGGVAAVAGGDEGWRWAFIVLALPSIVLAVWALWLREPQRGRNEQLAVWGAEAAAIEEVAVPLGAAFTRLKKIRSFYFFLVGLGAVGFALFSVPLFLNLFLEEHYGLDAAGRGVVVSLAQIGGLVGSVGGGIVADRLFRESPPKAVLLMGAAIASFGVVFTVGLYMPNLALLTIVVGISQLLTAAAFVTGNLLVASVVPYRLRAQGFAMIGLYLFLVGAFFGALITGSISDVHGPRTALAAVVPPAGLVGGALIAWGARHVRRDVSLGVEELREEQDERRRMATGAEIPVLQVRNLDFSYGPVQVLFDVSLDVHRGEVLALLGTNGAGKSTLLRAISGLGLPDRGVIRLAGKTITYADAETRVRMGIVQVPGGKAVFPTLTVGENLVAGAYTYVWDTDRVQRRADEVLDLFPALADRVDQRAGTLSGGEQQMLSLAKALLLDPEVLLIDELSLGLAPVVVQELLGVVERLSEQGLTMVVVEQSVNVALSIADRAVFMEKGEIRFEGPAAELLERDDLVRAVFLSGEGKR